MPSINTDPTVTRTKIGHALVYVGILVFAIWSVVSFREDLQKIEFLPLAKGWWAVAASALLSLLNYVLRLVRWHYYLTSLGHRVPWRAGALSYMAGFAFTLSPGKVGEMVRARYYSRYRVPLSDVTAAFLAERVMDMMVILLMGLALLASSPSYRPAMWIGIAGLVTTFAVLMLMPSSAEPLPKPFGGTAPRHKLMRSMATLLKQAKRLLGPRMIITGFALGIVAWGAEAVGFKIVADVIHPSGTLSWSDAIGIYSASTLIGALSFIPGGLGSTEAVMTALLYSRGLSLSEAFLLTLVCRVLTLWLAVVIGWLCVWLLRHER